LHSAVHAVLRHTDLGRALRATAEDGPIAAAFGINQAAVAMGLAGVCAALAGVAGVCLALSYTLDAVADLRRGSASSSPTVMLGGPRRRHRTAGRGHR
jgi:branched-chain amino acid transport system permease protein